jgi:hypothetical protein
VTRRSQSASTEKRAPSFCSSTSATTTSVPPRLARATDGTKDDSSSIDEFVEFPGRPRFLCAPGWKDVADYALAWAVEHAIASTARGDASDSHEEKGESS